MGRPAGWLKELTGRSAMISPGAPATRRSVERGFWNEIAKGSSSEDAAGAVGVSPAVGARWFRQGGGMPTITLAEPGRRHLSFAEREEIALLRVQHVGVREIARRVGRDPATISRELRRNAATRGGKLEYRASVAQWKAELLARRPKTAKLVTNPLLREYVQERLNGSLHLPDGSEVVNRTGFSSVVLKREVPPAGVHSRPPQPRRASGASGVRAAGGYSTSEPSS